MSRPDLDIRPDTPPDRVVVVASSSNALEMLRLAVLRSDDVLFVAEAAAPAARRFAQHFAVEVADRAFSADDLAGTTALLVSLDDREDENRIVRQARRSRVPVHVRDRPLVSDFTALAMLERSDGPRAAA